ncbi:hypothetical protein [Shewanella pneumatophori]|uniref:Uncharacterized protein n=1 Tax=Shewanella pneumatophori TaxID=314092 RepID=A0A9X2CDC6_9GAMM|nr:hypothetical protein [Shewanella pneumatophori]MCL1137822.1 hypothetical protein [Shewanella pneumatophori]
MKKVLIFFICNCFIFNLYANPYSLEQDYDCDTLNRHLENSLAVAPERKIRLSLNNWEDHKGEIPALKTPLVSSVYLLCEEGKNAERQVKDIVFDILAKAEYTVTSVSIQEH